MKFVKIILMMALGTVLLSCTDDSADNPAFGPNEVYLYDGSAATMSVKQGEEMTLEMVVSPNDGSVKCRWMLGNAPTGDAPVEYKQIGDKRNLVYAFPTAGTFKLKFEASRGTRTISKTFDLTVAP